MYTLYEKLSVLHYWTMTTCQLFSDISFLSELAIVYILQLLKHVETIQIAILFQVIYNGILIIIVYLFCLY